MPQEVGTAKAMTPLSWEKKAPNTYVARKKLESITCKKLSKANNDVWPKELGTYTHRLGTI